ncbi:MAG TPA: hypothetical protein VNO17_10520 [Actinomycetota bacterium]|nr:hypothetical protein [Actinomycetota bacterium]
MPVDIADRVESFPEPWRPEPGDKLVGTIIELGERASEYGGSYPLVTVMTDDGREVVWHAFHTVARSELARQRPEVGDRIAAKYWGRDEDRGYERYRVLVEHRRPAPSAAPDWEKVAEEAEAELGEGLMPPEEAEGLLPMPPEEAVK